MEIKTRRLDIYKIRRNSMLRAISVMTGIAVNVLLFFVTVAMDLPIFLDTAGTIGVSLAAGLFPGMMTAVITNLVCAFFYPQTLYFTYVNAFICLFTVLYVRNHPISRPRFMVFYIFVIGVGSGILGALTQTFLFQNPQNTTVLALIELGVNALGAPRLLIYLFVSTFINLIDKSFSALIAYFGLKLVPANIKQNVKNSGWRQRPLTEEEIRNLRVWNRSVKISARTRMALTFVSVCLVLVLLMGTIGIQLYFVNAKDSSITSAESMVKVATKTVDPERISEYIRMGRDATGYSDTEDKLVDIVGVTNDVNYLYIVRFGEKGYTYVFYAQPDDGTVRHTTGEFVPYERDLEPYVDDLRAGRKIEPVEIQSGWKTLISVFHPIKDKRGNVVCYAGADIVMDYMANYMRNFMLRVIFLLAGFFMLIISYAIWITDHYSVYPMTSITECLERFYRAGSSQEELDESVRRLRTLDIRTSDEVEKLYNSICKMTLEQAEQMRSIRRLSESTAKMQDGLIITMANLVENRDSDTGAHIQKTSAYVKIIVEGLQKKGYYPEKMTPKFISDVVRSAPLHDVGKINIPDSVLNKRSKLSDEEFEIIKTHTTAGRQIMERAISTVEGENYLKEARNMAAYHHERWDGKGYPEGLHGEVIPLSARIMSVADVFDALTSPRVYKPAFPLDQALSMIREGAGTQFDPKCVEVFLDSIPEIKVILNKYNQM